MFNIYTHEKRLKEEKEKLNNKKKEENIEKNRKSKLKFILFRGTSHALQFIREKDKKVYL